MSPEKVLVESNVNTITTQERVNRCFCNRGLFNNDITDMKQSCENKLHLEQFEINSIIQSSYTHDGKICVLVDWVGDYETSWELLQNIKTSVDNMPEHIFHSDIPITFLEIKSISQIIKTKDGQLGVMVDWVGDYKPSWELLENMPISIRSWKNNYNVNKSAASISPYCELDNDASVNSGPVKNKRDGPYPLDSFDMQYMCNRMSSPQSYNDSDKRIEVPFTSTKSVPLGKYPNHSQHIRQPATRSTQKTQAHFQQAMQNPHQNIHYMHQQAMQNQYQHVHYMNQQAMQNEYQQEIQSQHQQAMQNQHQQAMQNQYRHVHYMPQQEMQNPYQHIHYLHQQAIPLQGHMLSPMQARQSHI